MDTGQLVVVSCSGPREKFWGVLLALTPVGATARVVPIEAFEDFVRQFREGGQMLIAPVTVFLPAHRLERIELDESGGAVEGLGDRFRRLVDCDPLGVLLARGESASGEPQM